jgi:glycosyltransferase involved in cell wall biosynthesis
VAKRLEILHVLPRWSHGGAAQSLITEARFALSHGTGVVHRAMTLEPGGSLALLQQALRSRLRVEMAPPPNQEQVLVNDADVIVIHYWNTPALRRFIDRWRGRRGKWMVYSLVNGIHPPQRLPPALIRSACHTVLTSPHAVHLGRPGAVSVIPAIVLDRGEPFVPTASRPHGLLHIGTLNVFKLAPNFIELHAGLVSPEDPVTVVGAGGDEEQFQDQARALGVAREFAWPGFAEDPGALYRQFKLLSYPAAPFSYASSDRVVQEAQLQGLPVLLLRDSPLTHLVNEGITGVIANDAADYRARLEAIIAGDLALPHASMVAAAAREQHDPERKCNQLTQIYHQVSEGPVRELNDGYAELDDWLAYQGADLAKTGGRQRPSLVAMTDSPERLLAYQCWACEGGLAHYLKSDLG